MPRLAGDHLLFFQQFRKHFETTGAFAPSSRFLARAMTGPLRRKEAPVRVLEVGPGTGAVTRHIMRLLGPEDRLDMVELNSDFVSLLQQRLKDDPDYSRVADRAFLHQCPIQEFSAEAPYDFIISGLPLNNFPSGLVQDIFATFVRLLAPNGTLSYFEYMFVRSFRRTFAQGTERTRLQELEAIIGPYLKNHRIRRDWVFANAPPAWVQHLRPALS